MKGRIWYLPRMEDYKLEDMCNICNRYFYKKGNLESHIRKVHGQSVKVTMAATFSEDKDTHNIKYHVNNDDSDEESYNHICDFCDKVLPNSTQKTNHMLFQHTVRQDRLKCVYCGYICSQLMQLCKHISTEHSEMFQKRGLTENKCDMCYK